MFAKRFLERESCRKGRLLSRAQHPLAMFCRSPGAEHRCYCQGYRA